ncbi:MAG: DNA repair protein RecO [Bacteroidaceae bacterium]|nr:DNA repair protein RecO [Bacteroidaceae bacterium]
MFLSSPAIVLSKVRHTDSTQILTLYTQAEGSIPFAVRGTKSKPQAANLQPLTPLTIEWDHHPSRTMQHLKSVSLLSPLTSLTSHPHKAAVASLLGEALHHALRQERHGDIFPFLLSSLQWLDAASEPFDNFHLIFLMRLAGHLGIEPNLENAASSPFFDMINAECTPVQPQHNYYLPHSDLRLAPLMLNLGYANMHRISFTPSERHRALRAILAYYRIHIPGFPQLRSPEMLKDML